MLGSRAPRYMQGISVAGYHLHFLTENREKGGHVTFYRLAHGKFELTVISDVEIHLPRMAESAQANLCADNVHDVITEAEGAPGPGPDRRDSTAKICPCGRTDREVAGCRRSRMEMESLISANHTGCARASRIRRT